MVDKSKRKTICQHCMKIISDNKPCECRKQIDKDRKQRYAERNPELVKHLTSTKWAKFRKRIIARDGGHCQRCLALKNLIISTHLEVHHIKPRIKYPELIYEETNCITLCKLCNQSIGTRETLDFAWTTPEQGEYFL